MQKLGAQTAKILVLIYDVLLGALVMYLTIKLRFFYENKTPPDNIDLKTTFVFLVVVLLVWLLAKTHRHVWRFMSFEDVKTLLKSVIAASIITPLILFLFFNRAEHLPRSVPFIAGSLYFVLLLASRAVAVLYNNGDIKTLLRKGQYSKPPALLIGRSQALHDYMREESRKKHDTHYYIHGLIETDGGNKGRSIRGLPVIGNMSDIKTVVKAVEQSLGVKPTLITVDKNTDKTRVAKLVKLASTLGVRLVRAKAEFDHGLTPFEAADLIGRQTKSLDIEPVKTMLQNKCVLITGAGGTIGSELVRQISQCAPRHMVLVDASEMNLYTIDREMAELENLSYSAHLGDIRDKAHMNEIFKNEKPDIVLHAAALKHVPLMETNPVSTIMTNVGGTKIILEMVHKYNVKSFTLISTDKAVNPNNIMGASKRIAEILTMTDANGTSVSLSAVRFGNVLASSGSVIPLFEKQIEEGGPVTVTDKKVTRYFMTKEEAASLVLQAAALNLKSKAKLPRVYVLDMGEPVNITRLARQLIRLRGMIPDRDIKIIYTGLRPGEKLEEKLTSDTQKLKPTRITGVLYFTDKLSDKQEFAKQINKLLGFAKKRDKKGMIKVLKQLVPEFTNGNGSG